MLVILNPTYFTKGCFVLVVIGMEDVSGQKRDKTMSRKGMKIVCGVYVPILKKKHKVERYNENHPHLIPFSEVKQEFEKEYYIDLKKGVWGKKEGSWVECSIGGGWGKGRDFPHIAGVFDRTILEHMNTYASMYSKEMNPRWADYD
jgi:hypothetical protein